MWSSAARRGLRATVAVCVAVLLTGIAMNGHAQRVSTMQRWGWYRIPPRFPQGRPDRRFTFARGMHESVTREPRGQGWYTDYSSADVNFMTRLSELTTTRVSEDRYREPEHVVIRLTDPELFDYAFIFMSDVGTVGFSDAEVAWLRR